MTTFRSDPLLGIARGTLTVLMALTAVVFAALIAAIPIVIYNQATILAEFAKNEPGLAHPETIGAILGIILFGGLVAVVIWLFLRLLKQIVDSVASGDPFVPENADRLKKMGWLTLIGQLVTIPGGLLGMWIESVSKDTHIEMGISLSGLLLALVLFILARVFRTGATMREELEGTV